MTSVHTDFISSDDLRRKQIYEGDLFAYRPMPPTEKLCAFARELVEEAFHPHDAELAQYALSVEEYAAILAELKPRFIHHERCKELIAEIVRAVGADIDTTYFDVPRLRSSTSDDFLTTGIAYAFHPHRDTWYSAPHCQINWWLPIYEIGAASGMAIHPAYFANAVENSSECYDYYRWNRESRKNAASHIGTDSREQPKALEAILLEPDVRIVTPPAGMFQFSAAHLHSSIPNNTGRTRFSIDFRTVHLDDVASHGGARNIDSKCTGTNLRDFMCCSNLEKLPEELVLPYDEGGRPPEDAVLTFEHSNQKAT